MAIDPGSVGVASRPSVVGWTSDQCLLYALGVGAGMDDASSDLPFTTENSEATDQRMLPTFPVVLASPSVGEALAGIGPFDHAMLVHGEQEVELHGPLPIEGRVTVRSAVTGIWDKGSGALVETETSGHAVDGGTPLFTLRASLFIRGEGGFGGSRGPSPGAAIPERAPDHRVDYRTRPDQALLYRLSGDRNPLHSDPKYAARAGFERPILHGLCTFGFSGRALLDRLCGGDPDRVRSIRGRFSRPVLPGDPLTVSIWDQGGGEAWFQTAAAGDVVLDAGRFRYSV
jgi:acyl dehydratase